MSTGAEGRVRSGVSLRTLWTVAAIGLCVVAVIAWLT